MSRSPSPFSAQQKLNRSTPATADVGLGDIINDLIVICTAQNAAIAALKADHNTLVAKLNADAGVTDTNYAASTAAAAVADVVPLVSR